ncbi:MAG: phosphoesterase [Acidobacteria bacterium]|nr:phosphoesterase [Acidobacteriota bacterium]HJN43273.1 DNA repair exonuclease [Vicinamibacterales bacterium]
MTFRFVHAADLHLDSPFKGIRETERRVADILRRATFEAYERVIELCVDRRVDALLVAGDIFDGADGSLAAQIHFVRGLERLDAAGIRAFICHGNHDPLDGWGARLTMPPSVHQFGEHAEAVPVDPQSSTGPVVCGVSYPTREIRSSLLPGFPPPAPGRVTIGMLHANVGASTGHEAYAPCTVEELAATGYDYWALGHVHTRAILRDEAPLVAYPGNTQGRHPNERGARGVYLVQVDDRGGQVTISQEFVATDRVRWEQVDLQIDGIDDDTALFGRLQTLVDDLVAQADGRYLVYRVRLEGRGPVHESLARAGSIDDLSAELNQAWGSHQPFAFCGGIVDETKSRLDRAALAESKDFIGDFLALTDAASRYEALAAELQRALAPLYDNTRARKYLGNRLPDTDEVRGMVAAAEDIALGLLIDDAVGEAGAGAGTENDEVGE